MEFMRITSAANPSIKLAKNLAQHSRAARKEGLSLAEGIHLAQENFFRILSLSAKYF